MNYSLTIFKSIFDNKTHRQMTFQSFDEFESTMKSLQKDVKRKPKKGERPNEETAALISPAIYKRDTTRANSNVIQWGGWVALDIDDYDGTIDTVLDRFKTYRHFCYSSASSSKEKPKCRIVLPLTRPIQNEKIKHLWFAINKEFGEINDPQTKDLSRMYYIPAQYPNAYTFFSNNQGNHIDPDVLMNKHTNDYEVLKETSGKWPEKINEMLASYKKENLTNTDIQWSSYRDCAFVNQQLVTEYKLISETGWYHKMYQIMVSIASKALRRGYPITPNQIETLCKEIDSETGGWYKHRPLGLEAARALEFALKSN
tara:strand:+ start:524 stop:1465 length:942 start_codon:yes stop_codon:yes gene_type:complete